MTLRKLCRPYARRAGIIALVGIITALLLLRPSVSDAAADGSSAPTNVACQGWEADTVIISWKDNDDDEVSYQIERSIDGAAFSLLTTVMPNGDGNYPAYHDEGINTALNHRYRVRGVHADGTTFTNYGPVCNNRRIAETGGAGSGFRLFFGLEGTTDDCPSIDGNDVCLTNSNPGGTNPFVALQQSALEGSADAFGRVGFDRDAAVPSSGLDKIPVNVIWCDGGGCAGGSSLGLSPFLMEKPFDNATRVGDPIAYLVSEHEVFHFQQFKYGGLSDPAGAWVIEGQARSSQDKICIGADTAGALCFDDIATGYAGYVGEINGYLGNTATPVNQSSYAAALFWTYVTEKFGTSDTGLPTEAGMNLMVEFWKSSADDTGRDGIAVLNSALDALGTTMRFRDIWKDFAVANYAKNLTGPSVPAKYKYEDMAEPGGTYNAVSFAANQSLALNGSFLQTGQTIYPWAAKYYRFTPTADVPVLDIQVNQDSNTPVYYTILGVKNNDITYEYNFEGRNLNQTVLNNAFDEVVVMVAGLDNLANYRISVNGTQPTLAILSPTTGNKARVGSKTEPEKFRVAVQVLAANGTPLTGVDLANFNFRVGTKVVADDQILTSAHVQDQQWFILRAPTQEDAATTYDLHVDYAESTVLSATQSLAVNYAPRTDADNMLLIDRSGSMAGPKIEAAKNAARLYVDSWRVGDMIGVVGFDHTVNVNLPLQDWTESPSGGSRQDAFDAIDSLTPGGATHIGDALTEGFDQLTSSGDPAHDWALILLSDGVEEGPPYPVNFADAISNISGASGKKPVIHAIAIGPNADGPKMQNAANATGGTYQFVSAPVAASVAGMATTAGINSPDAPTAISNPRLDLDARYRYIATEVLGQQQFFSLEGPLDDNDGFGDVVTIPVEGSVAELVLSLSFDGVCSCNIQLRDPSNAIVPFTLSGGRHLVWRISEPQAGNWTLRINVIIIGAAADAPQQDTEFLPAYLVQSGIKSDVILDAALTVPVAERVSGVPMPIVASLTDVGPITGASVEADIVKPNGTTSNLTLYDDGSHGDGAADDGIYANTFYQTGQAAIQSGGGSYNVTVTANGTSAVAGGAFTRQKLLGFFIYSGGDDDGDGVPDDANGGDEDGDGLPDTYEETHGGDSTTLDPTADPDGDGSPTGEEFENGTDPFDPDSDDGGETDGSEADHGTDPHDPSDDGIEPTWTVAYPGISKVFVRYAPRDEYEKVQIYRSTSFTGTYSFLTEAVSPTVMLTGMVTDTAVTNGQEYCYYVVGINAGGLQSTPLTPSCATPKADPWPPEGGFLINDGASSTDSVDVSLRIFASDAVSPHTQGQNPLDDLMIPPASSATEVTEMRISNSPDMSGAVFEPFIQIKPWTLGQTTGLATVYMQFRDAAGNISEIVVNSILVEDEGSAFDERLSFPILSKQ